MNRERKFGTALSVAGVLTLPFFIGIPLLATGILVLVKGDHLRAGPWIRVLFWMVLTALALGVALFFAFPIEGQDAETGIARSILCIVPVFLAILLSLAMAALTAARFHSLSRKHRIMGLALGVLCVFGVCIALVLAFPWQTLGVTVLLAVVWACVAWSKRRRARRVEALRNPPADVTKPVCVTSIPTAPAPAPKASKEPKPPRVRKPACAILAWLMPLSAVPLGFLILMLFDTAGGVISLLLPIAWAAVPLMVALWGSPRVRQSPLRILALLTPSAAMFALCFPIFSGGDDWGLGSLAWAVIPLMIALGTAPILAIASLWRRERFPGLAAVVLVGYGGWLTVYGLEQVHEAFGGVGLLMVFTAAVGVPAAWLMWRFRKRFAALGVGTKQV